MQTTCNAHGLTINILEPWPIVERFLNDLPDGAVGLDIGCGNGRYLAVNPNIFILASDRSLSPSLLYDTLTTLNNGRSSNLVQIASQRHPYASIIADGLSLPHPNSTFDFAISIAVIHHFSTPVRRIKALAEILNLLRPLDQGMGGVSTGRSVVGKALIFVWALEQNHGRRRWDDVDQQDVMVPWIMKPEAQESRGGDAKTFLRYYHLYRQGELAEEIVQSGGVVESSGYEKDNWWAIATRRVNL